MQLREGLDQRATIVLCHWDIVLIPVGVRQVIEEQVVVRRVGGGVMTTHQRGVDEPCEGADVVVDFTATEDGGRANLHAQFQWEPFTFDSGDDENMGAPGADRFGALERMHATAEGTFQPRRRDVSRAVRHGDAASV